MATKPAKARVPGESGRYWEMQNGNKVQASSGQTFDDAKERAGWPDAAPGVLNTDRTLAEQQSQRYADHYRLTWLGIDPPKEG